MRKRNYLLALFFIYTFIIATQAKTIYLDPVNGSNSNPGTLVLPLASLESVVNVGMIETRSYSPLPYTNQSVLTPKNSGALIQPGDTLMLLDGYHGDFYFRGAYNLKTINVIGNSKEAQLGSIRLVAGSNWQFENLTVSGEPVDSYSNGRLVYFESHGFHGPTRDLAIKNCLVQSIENSNPWTLDDWLTKSASGIYSKGGNVQIIGNELNNVSHGITVTGDSALISDNSITNFSADGIRPLGNDIIVEYNTIKNCYDIDDNHDDGIQVWSSGVPKERIIIRGNTIINFEDPEQAFRGPLQGIGCFDGPYQDWIIENNVVIVDHWHGITLMGAYDCRIINNTVLDPTPDERPGPVWIRIADHKDGTPSQGCIVANNIANTFTIDALDVQNLSIKQSEYDEYFVDFVNGDLRLKAGSPAIDAGSDRYAPPIDLAGTLRPQGSSVDVGAYEWKTTTAVSQEHVSPYVLYPNPTKDFVFIESQEFYTFSSLFLIDGLGRQVDLYGRVEYVGKNKVKLLLQALPHGIYQCFAGKKPIGSILIMAD